LAVDLGARGRVSSRWLLGIGVGWREHSWSHAGCWTWWWWG
jgi:hypothetical protein